MYTSIRDAHLRHLKRPEEPLSYIPVRCQTVVAPACFSWHHDCDGWDPTAAPVRLDCYNPYVLPLCTPQLMEDFVMGGSLEALPKAGESAPMLPLEFTVSARAIECSAQTLTALIEELQEEDESWEEPEPPALGADSPSARPTAEVVANSLSGLACWPRIVLDEGGGAEDEQPILVETRGAEGEPRISSWQTVMLMLSEQPAPISAGDVISVSSEIEIEAGVDSHVDSPARYTVTATVERRS